MSVQSAELSAELNPTAAGRGVLTRMARWAGIDGAVAFTVFNRVWQAGSGLVTLWFIAHFLSREEQGYFYTFGSVLALSVFFELGLAGVIGTFAAHEMAHLRWTADRRLEGDPVAKARLGSLLRMSIKWYGVAALLMLLSVGPGGYAFFVTLPETGVVWRGPWTVMLLFSALCLCITPAMGVLEGCGLVKQVALLRLAHSVTGGLFVWAALAARAGLFAACIPLLVGFAWSSGWIILKMRRALADLWRHREPGVHIAWRQEIWPLQWKIAFSWLSGYFIFQLFTPVLMRYRGPVEAGQMGMSLSLAGGLQMIGVSWIATRVPRMGQLIARKDFVELDRVFFPTLRRALAVATLGAAVVWLAAVWLHWEEHPSARRLLSPLPLAAILLNGLINIFVTAIASYLRAHKDEPFLWNSIVAGLVVGTCTIVIGMLAGAAGISLAYLVANAAIGGVWGTWIFMRKRTEWHHLTKQS